MKNRTIAAVVAFCAILSTSACATTQGDPNAPVDTGILGVKMPPGSQEISSNTSEGVAAYKVPDQRFEEVSKWIADHRPPDTLNSLRLQSPPSSSDGSRNWCWSSSGSPSEVLLISAKPGNPVTTQVRYEVGEYHC